MKFTIPSGQWHGDRVTKTQVNNFTLAEILYSPGYEISPHAHESAIYYLVQDGSFSQRYGRKVREGVPSSLIYLRSGETHSDKFHGQGARCFVIEIANDWLSEFNERFSILESSAIFQGGLPTWFAARIYDEYQTMDRLSPLAIEGLALELIAETSRQWAEKVERKTPDWLQQTTDYIHEHFSENISLSTIANAVSVHPIHLARTFRHYHQCSIGEFVRRLRIEFACRGIMSTDDSLAHIALTAGFYDQSHFSKVFKRITKLTPTQYRTTFRRKR